MPDDVKLDHDCCLAARYEDITHFREEVLNLPLARIDVKLSNDDLQVTYEDAVCDYLLR